MKLAEYALRNLSPQAPRSIMTGCKLAGRMTRRSPGDRCADAANSPSLLMQLLTRMMIDAVRVKHLVRPWYLDQCLTDIYRQMIVLVG